MSVMTSVLPQAVQKFCPRRRATTRSTNVSFMRAAQPLRERLSRVKGRTMRDEPSQAHPEQHERRGDGDAHSYVRKLCFAVFHLASR